MQIFQQTGLVPFTQAIIWMDKPSFTWLYVCLQDTSIFMCEAHCWWSRYLGPSGYLGILDNLRPTRILRAPRHLQIQIHNVDFSVHWCFYKYVNERTKKNAHIQIVPNPNVHCCVNFFSQICKQWRRRSVHRYSNCQLKWAISVSWDTI